MTDPTRTPAEAPHFDTSDVDANRAIEQDIESADGASVNAGDRDALDQTVGRRAASDGDEQLSSASET